MQKNITNIFIGLAILACAFFFEACLTKSEDSNWISIWNGVDLKGWHSYLGVPHESVDISGIVRDSSGSYTNELGIDQDPLNVFDVVNIDQQSAIKISGEVFGMIYTEASYQNYHLKLKVKWGEKKFAPRKEQKRDSGLLYHGFGKPGSADFWMGSQELQIQETDMGDYWPVGEVEIDIPSKPSEDIFFIYDEKAPLRTYYWAKILETDVVDSLVKRRCLKYPDGEKAHGQWNDIELICLGDQSIHIVNGQIVMRLFNSRKVENGQEEVLDKGKIILQSEGAELYYKDLYIRPITEIPKRFR